MYTLKPIAAALLCLTLAGPVIAATSDTTALESQTRRTDTLAAQQGTTRVKTSLVEQFRPLAGSKENATSLVGGLRSGKSFDLVTTVENPDGSKTDIVTPVNPGTKPMGWGNVSIALALTKESLAQQGITSPTDAELKAALTGGTITIVVAGQPDKVVTFRGVLAMRADGMGWGQIAHSLGLNLGHIVSEMKSGNDKIAKGRSGSDDHGKAANESHGKSEQARADKAERVGKVDRAEKLDRAEMPDRPDHPVHPDRPERPERATKAR